MILSYISESKNIEKTFEMASNSYHSWFFIIHFYSKSRYLQNLTFFCFGHILANFCSNQMILDIFKQPKRWAVQKCPRYHNLSYFSLSY